MGSKRRFAKELLPIILNDRIEGRYYVEPFCGGCNVIDKVDGNRIANDYNQDLIAMWKSLQGGWIPPDYTKEDYEKARTGIEFPDFERGYMAVNCSYSGKWFGGFAGVVKTKVGTIRDYQSEAKKNVLKQIKNLESVDFRSGSYKDLQIPRSSIIYCDPPYKGTTGYGQGAFDHDEFWQWCRDKVRQGHKVFVSEYNAPSDWTCVWEKRAASSLSANGKIGGNKISVERLFKMERKPK